MSKQDFVQAISDQLVGVRLGEYGETSTVLENMTVNTAFGDLVLAVGGVGDVTIHFEVATFSLEIAGEDCPTVYCSHHASAFPSNDDFAANDVFDDRWIGIADPIEVGDGGWYEAVASVLTTVVNDIAEYYA